MPLQLQDLLELVNGTHDDFQTLRDDAERRQELYAMRRDPYVPSEIAREGVFQFKSPLLIDAAKAIRSDIMMNPTEFTVLPLDRDRNKTVPRGASAKAENLERALAVIWGQLNSGRHLDYNVIWNQLINPYAVLILNFNELEYPSQPEWMDDEAFGNLIDQLEAEWMPWSIYEPDPLTCSWIEKGGKPQVMARRYKMMIRDVEDSYAQRRGSVRPEAFLRFGADGRWQWQTDDYQRESSMIKQGFREVEMVWVDDGDYIYQAVLNPGTETGGELLWQQPNPIGRVTGFVIPGNTTPSRRPEDRYEPFLLPLMQIVMQLNDLRSTRATAARNLAGPNMYVSVPPETAVAYLNKDRPIPTSFHWERNVVQFLIGDLKSAPSELNEDWDKLDRAVSEELQRYLPSPFVHIVDPAVLKAATATSILHAAETGLRLYGPLMAAYDSAIHDMMDAIITSIRTTYPDIDMRVHATGEEVSRGKNIKEGSVYRFGIKAIDFAHRVMVKTRGMSQAQAAAQYDLILRQWVLPDGSKGPATMDDVIDAANYTDRDAQKAKLAVEAILGSIDPWIQQMATQVAADEIELETGLVLPIGPAQPQQNTPSRIPGGAQRMDGPQIASPEGGSESTVLGG